MLTVAIGVWVHFFGIDSAAFFGIDSAAPQLDSSKFSNVSLQYFRFV